MRYLLMIVSIVLASTAMLAQHIDEGGGGNPFEHRLATKKSSPPVHEEYFSQLQRGDGAAIHTTTHNRETTISQISSFPFQELYDTYRSYYESCPIVLGNGSLLVTYVNPGQDSLFAVRSTDGGTTWSAASLVRASRYFRALSTIRTVQGRIIVTWAASIVVGTTSYGLSMCSSDDEGLTWTAVKTISENTADYYLTLSQTLDKTLWLCYSRYNSATSSDTYCRTSNDNGATWSAEKTLGATPSSESYATVVSKDSSTLLAFTANNSSGNYDIYSMTSTDAGTSWSSAIPVANTLTTETRPRVLRQSNGILWLVYQHYKNSTGGYTQSEIAYKKSTDGGITWSSAAFLTNYAGFDGWFNACLSANQPFVTFASYRWCISQYQTHLWYGLIGTSTDNNTPPVLTYYTNSTPVPNNTISVLAYVDDEAGVSSVQLFYHINGIAYSSVQMYDDGLHDDNTAGDKIYGATFGPFQLGDVFDFSIGIRDINSNLVSVYVNSFTMPAIHNTGNIMLKFFANSALGDLGASPGYGAYWPKTNGYDYLYDGGLWVGSTVGGQNLVMKHFYATDMDWHQTYGSTLTLAPGKSDQDGDVTYDDDYAASHIGLQVRQQSYQWSNSTRDDFIIFTYTITNKGPNSVLNNVYAGFWTDPDVAAQTTPGSNWVGYDSERHLMYAYNTQNSPAGYFGIKLLGSGAVPSTVYSWRSGQLDEFAGMPYFQCLTKGGATFPDSIGDVRMLLVASPFSLPLSASTKIAFGMVLGNGLSELQSNADTMETIFRTKLMAAGEPISADTRIPTEFSLSQNFPNPFNPSTTLRFGIPIRGRVKISIFTVLGQLITEVLNQEMNPGYYEKVWNASVPSGVYFYRIEATSATDPQHRFMQLRKMVVLR